MVSFTGFKSTVVSCLAAAQRNEYISRYWPVAVMVLPAMLILLPLLGRGYLLHYDMVFSPRIHFNIEALREGGGLYNSLPVTAALKLMSLVMPMDIVQKLILFTIFFLCMYCLYVSVPVRSRSARLLGGLMYTLNPFTYDRFMAGHWKLLLAYALTPLVMRAMYDLFVELRRKHLALVAVWWSLAVIINAHHLVILGLLFFCLGLVYVRSRRSLLYAMATIAGVLLLNSWWLIPGLIAPNLTQTFGLEQMYAFATRVDLTHGIWFNMLSLQGFWHGGWRSLKELYDWWPLLVMIWLAPVFTGLGGVRTYARNHGRLIAGLMLASLVSLVLAAGPYPAVSGLNSWIFTNVPGMSGMREAQKFLALLALSYAVLASYGLDLLLRKRYKRTVIVLGAVTMLVTLLLARPMLWGASGQLRPMQYPASWYQFDERLRNDGSNSRVVVLPWELYVDKTFTGTLVANPAQAFYGDRVIQSQRMNLIGVEDTDLPRYRGLGESVAQKDTESLQAVMYRIGARYVMVTEGHRQGEYAWLTNQPGTTVVINDHHLLVIRIDK